jgi:glycosyltransferase involved in cell wall biosynthesis
VAIPPQRIVQVGPVPPPVGGVASHVSRLVTYLRGCGIKCEIVDPYPAHGKRSVPESGYWVIRGIWGVPRFLWLLHRKNAEVLHFHFSTLSPRFVIITALIARRRRRFVATFHHGDLAGELSRFPNWFLFLTRCALSRYDRVAALSSRQQSFLSSFECLSGRIVRWPTSPPNIVCPDGSSLPPSVSNIKAVEDGGELSVIIISGYPERLYGFEFGLNLLDTLRARFPVRLVVCLYGASSDPKYSSSLRVKLAQTRDVIVLDELNPAAFLALLRMASLYIRPTLIDSYGLSVQDAVEQGTPCVASDVCERDPRSFLFKSGQQDDLNSIALRVLEDGRRRRCRNVPLAVLPPSFDFSAVYQE